MKATRMAFLAAVLLPCTAFCGEEVYNFEDEAMKEGESAVKQSTHFVFTLTGDGDTDNLDWQIKQDSSAPSPKNVLAILKADAVDTGFPIAFLKAKKFQDCEVSVKFKIIGGNVNQAAGLIFRAVDADHCYLLRASAVDSSMVLLRVNKKVRTKLASGKVAVPVNRWNTIRVVLKGSEMQCFLNDTKAFTGKDVDYPLGKVGMITQADSATCFDDFTITTSAP